MEALNETVDGRGKMAGDEAGVGYEDKCGGDNDYHCYQGWTEVYSRR